MSGGSPSASLGSSWSQKLISAIDHFRRDFSGRADVSKAGTVATARWMSTLGRAAGDSVPVLAEQRSDGRGMLTFCEVPIAPTVRPHDKD